VCSILIQFNIRRVRSLNAQATATAAG